MSKPNAPDPFVAALHILAVSLEHFGIPSRSVNDPECPTPLALTPGFGPMFAPANDAKGHGDA